MISLTLRRSGRMYPGRGRKVEVKYIEGENKR